ncbi:MAG: precorrin-4/cobalt-precorrin-4 C11-methyltransferase [Clostridia bacterium]|nr:precorrin-4/cobalt-precorrin-4 C11-methyltransferase [Clostridia bacterium]
MTVFFVGAGPGDPELITVKGRNLLERADVIIYTGSLVNPKVLDYANSAASVYDSSSLTLEEVLDIIKKAISEGRTVVRLHTGDPSLYGAIQEQVDSLIKLGIPYEIIPGVSSFAAAAAAVKREYTLPGISQTLILTRRAGRTPVPAKESLPELSKHRTSLCLFLSTQALEEATAELAEGYGLTTPAAVVYKASWPEEKIVWGTLEDIAQKAKDTGISRTALLLVGDFLGKGYNRSCLYDPSFGHGYREVKRDD